MTSRTLKIAGWLAMASAFLTFPLVYYSYKLEGRVDLKATAIQTIIQISGTILFVVIVWYSKKLLNDIFHFHNTDINLDLLIIAGILTGICSVLVLYIAPLKESIGYAAIAIVVAQGIVQVQFGYKLLKLPFDFGGMIKPFCYANMATGILLATVILIPLGILASAISDLMLGTIFLNMSKVIKHNELSKLNT